MADQPSGMTQIPTMEPGSSSLPVTYAVVFNAMVTANDVLLSFGGPAVTPPEGKGAKASVALAWTHTIAMSPQTAKQLAHILGMNIQHYEKQFGTINIPLPGPQIEGSAKATKSRKSKPKRAK